MRIEDSLDKEKYQYNLSGFHLNHSSKLAMQNLYKSQLDDLVIQKKHQKDQEKQREMNEKKQYNERVQNNKQSQKIKDQAYKNYYNMLLNNQQQLKSSYVSPYSLRDTMKDQHIGVSVDEGEKRMRQWEIEYSRRENEKRNLYKTELREQIEERKRLNSRNREVEEKKKEEYRKFGKTPSELHQLERQKHLEEMNKYKDDLDKVKEEKKLYRTRQISEQHQTKLPLEQHHALINPVPFNIQNPYILKEMNRQSYLAHRGNQNFSQPSS